MIDNIINNLLKTTNHKLMIPNHKSQTTMITIEGPTASGKSELALALAKELDTEIISADSRQVYRYLDIGTAKPNKQTQQEIRHHLIDIINPNERYSVGSFVKDAKVIINDLHSQGKIPIICGGTMLYIKSLLEGLSEIPPIPDDVQKEVKEYMQANRLIECYNFVKSFDKVFAESISATDKQRISRAIEVWLAYKTPLTEFWKQVKETSQYKPYRIYLDIDRELLYQRINKRVDRMVEMGLIEEIKSILEMGFTKDDYGLNTVGYKELVPIISINNQSKIPQESSNGNIPPSPPLQRGALSVAIDLVAQHTRNYAKRQMTWYRGRLKVEG